MAKFVPAKLFLTLIFAAFVALMITVAPLQTHNAHAAARTSTVTTHPDSSTYTCNWRTYTLSSSLELVRTDGYTVYLQASNMNSQYSVQVWNDGSYAGEYYLPYYDGSEIYVYVGTYGGEYVNACTDWS